MLGVNLEKANSHLSEQDEIRTEEHGVDNLKNYIWLDKGTRRNG